MNLFTKRFGLVLAGVVGVGAVATLAMGASLAMFTSTAAPVTDTFTTGTLNLTANNAGQSGTAATTLTYDNLVPGYDSLNNTDNGVGVSQSGGNQESEVTIHLINTTINSFVGINFTVTSTASQPCPSDTDLEANCTGTGQLPLYNGQAEAGSMDLQMQGVGLDTGQGPILTAAQIAAGTTCTPGSNVAPSGSTPEYLWSCSHTINDVLVPQGSNTTGLSATNYDEWGPDVTPASSDPSAGIVVHVSIPLSTPNTYQGSTASVTVSAFAVQAVNNIETGNPPTGCAPGVYPTGFLACPVSWTN